MGKSIDLIVGMKFPAYLLSHHRKVLWIMHQYRQAYDLWSDWQGLINDPRGLQVKELIEQCDRRATREARKIFTISKNVSQRLRRHLGVESGTLYPPPRNAGRFHCAAAKDYLFFPSRISPVKRHELVLEAMAVTRQPVRVRFAGTGDTVAYEEQIKRRAEALGVAERTEWLGWVSDAELIDHYAHARGVVFPPIDEDYGYITLEAMLSAKPVITCTDSGGALEFVTTGETGLVAKPTAEHLAAAMDELWGSRQQARRWGEVGRRDYDRLITDWGSITETILA